jgi:hypothetical protein
MSNIKFVSHEEFTEDQYTLELVYLLIDDKYRVAYVRKLAKNGGKFWGMPTLAVTKDGTKHYYECFLQDSVFLEKDVKKFLDDREWESGKVSIKCAIIDEDLPF